jgi:tetratricopeptide (TPR) repeat protein
MEDEGRQTAPAAAESFFEDELKHLIEENELERAATVLEEIIRGGAATAAAYSLLGRIYHHLGENGKARETLSAAIELDPSSHLVRDCLVHLERKRRRKRFLGILSISLPPLVLISIVLRAFFPAATGSDPGGAPAAIDRSAAIVTPLPSGDVAATREQRDPESGTVITGYGTQEESGKAVEGSGDDIIASSQPLKGDRSPEKPPGGEKITGGTLEASVEKEDRRSVSSGEWTEGYRKAVDLNFRGEYRESLAILGKLDPGEGPPDLRDNLLFWKGVNLRRLGRIQESEECLERLVEEFPGSNKLKEARAILGRKQGRGEL